MNYASLSRCLLSLRVFLLSSKHDLKYVFTFYLIYFFYLVCVFCYKMGWIKGEMWCSRETEKEGAKRTYLMYKQ